MAVRLGTRVLLGTIVRPLTDFGLKALFLTCQHRQDGQTHVPDVVAGSLEESQVQLIGGLLGTANGRAQIRLAIETEQDVRVWGRMH
jgi:hypothetical protein